MNQPEPSRPDDDMGPGDRPGDSAGQGVVDTSRAEAPRALRWDGSPSGPPWSEAAARVRDLVDQRLVRVGAGIVAVVAVALWWFLNGAAPGGSSGPSSSGPLVAGGTTIPFASAASAASGTDGSPSADREDGSAEIVVHAAGAVVGPGVYRLPTDARVGELVAAAGGLAPDADGDRLNLAEPLRDGVRVYVPRAGDPDIPTVAAVDGPVDDAAGNATEPGPGGGQEPVDLNRATLDELDLLPGIGPATAQAIVAHREEHGRFTSVDELLEVRGIGPAKLAQLRDLVGV